MIDEAIGRVLTAIGARGWTDDVDIVFTTDHGELQGDFGLLFKGPYHCDALMRIPMIWRPAPNASVTPAVSDAPVGQVDLAPTFCGRCGLGGGAGVVVHGRTLLRSGGLRISRLSLRKTRRPPAWAAEPAPR